MYFRALIMTFYVFFFVNQKFDLTEKVLLTSILDDLIADLTKIVPIFQKWSMAMPPAYQDLSFWTNHTIRPETISRLG